MVNIVYGLAFVLINFILVLFAYRQFGKTGLMVWIAMSTIIANIQVIKGIEILGMQATLGNTLYGSIFLATDILNEKYGLKIARKAVYIGFFGAITLLITMQMALVFVPIQEPFPLAIQEAFELIFSLSVRIVIGSLLAYLVSQILDIWIYNRIKLVLPENKYLWLRNNGSTLISQFVDTIIFVTIAFWGSPYSLLQIILSTFGLKLIIALLDTPFIYWALKIKPSEI